ncbi:CDP-diacylglycerol--glycerol-3-phosphate 3-phosphatidyltransferase, mitochondrial isoform X2 [Lingula anatina]|nr:CDP-diacylglycerol--glycerol-3-phosphate 3-phosphatidyltransferase, mitochondrial isoform X2 [Lingula anatina]|eukprot:XP_013396298.1 CDP-diacylglycerol--glycerol-3-phosphate 3-phosphatidyltransferase, mitochondrial isoform X2 [Lingula anatina]
MDEMRKDLLQILNWFKTVSPCFGVCGRNVRILDTPTEYFEALKANARKAEKRIVISALYLGTGALEKELIDCLHNVSRQKSSQGLKVHVLLDYTRGTRGESNSRSLLLPLLKDTETTVQVSLFHTPELRGIWKKLIPERVNETIGVQHIKSYIFDDTVIISGANLSESYFTNRQDRYVVIENSPEVADFFNNLVSAVSSFSFQLAPDDTVGLNNDLELHPYLGDQGSFKQEARKRLQEVLSKDFFRTEKHDNKESENLQINTSQSSTANSGENESGDIKVSENKSKESNSVEGDVDTWVCPLVQMGIFGITHDHDVTQGFWKKALPNSKILMASGYFNLTDHYMDVILQNSRANFSILMASEEVNGFYGARGLAGNIPAVYTHIAKGFYDRICAMNLEERIKLFEFYKPQWTYHAKGLWYYLPGSNLPSVTFVGSPNFGHRSVNRDLEAQIAVITTNSQLKEQLHQEASNLWAHGEAVDEETFQQPHRQVHWLLRFFTRYVRSYF